MIEVRLRLRLDDEPASEQLSQLLAKGTIQVAFVEICQGLKESGNNHHSYCLTPAERRVLEAIAQHDTREEAAQSLCISHNTVRKHLENIYLKLGVRSLHRAVAVALRCGLIR